MDKKSISIILGMVLFFSNRFVCLAASIQEAAKQNINQPQEKNLFSAQEFESCEKVISLAVAAFKEKKYELLHSYFFQPFSYNAKDITEDKEYFLSLVKMAEEELGNLESYSAIPFDAVPRSAWMCFGENIFIAEKLKSYPRLYCKTYRAVFSKIKDFPIYMYTYVYVNADKYSIRDFGLVLPSDLVDPFFSGLQQVKEMESKEKRKDLSCILFLQAKMAKRYAQGYKAKVLADACSITSGIAEYFLPTKEGQFVSLQEDYESGSGIFGDAELQSTRFNPPSKLEDGEQVFTFLTEGNEPLKLKSAFKNGKLFNQVIRLDSIKEGETGEKKVSIVSQKGYLVDFDLSYRNGDLVSLKINPRVHPFASGVILSCYSDEDREELKKIDTGNFREELRKELDLD